MACLAFGIFEDFGDEAKRYRVDVVFADEMSTLPLPGRELVESP